MANPRMLGVLWLGLAICGCVADPPEPGTALGGTSAAHGDEGGGGRGGDGGFGGIGGAGFDGSASLGGASSCELPCSSDEICCLDQHGHNPTCVKGDACP